MNWGNRIALTLAIEDAILALAYAAQKDWAKFAYWIFAAGITATTIFLK